MALLDFITSPIKAIKNLFVGGSGATTTQPPPTPVAQATPQMTPANNVYQSKPQISPNVYQPKSPPTLTSTTSASTIPVSSITLPEPKITLESPKISPNISGDVIDLGKITPTKTPTVDQKTIADLSSRLNELYKTTISLQESIPKAITPPSQSQVLGGQITDENIFQSVINKYKISEKQQAIDTMRQRILAATQVFDDAVKELSQEGGVPENIRQKRVQYLQNQADKNLKALELQYNFLIDDYNKSLDLAKSEVSNITTAQERQRDNARQMIQQLISTGGLGGLSDDELNQWASVSGYPLESLKSLRKAVKQGNDLKIQKTLDQMQAQAANLDLARQRLEVQQTGGGNRLTLIEAKNLGLPTSLVGMSEAEIGRDLENPTPPNWFKTMTENRLRSSILPSILQVYWDEFKKNLEQKKTAGSTSEEIVNPFK
jgi:hypothetical protein